MKRQMKDKMKKQDEKLIVGNNSSKIAELTQTSITQNPANFYFLFTFFFARGTQNDPYSFVLLVSLKLTPPRHIPPSSQENNTAPYHSDRG